MRVKSTLLVVASVLMLCSCSGDKDKEEGKEKGRIEAMTEKAGQEAVKAIKTPVNKAQNAADLAEQRAKEFEESRKE